MVVEQGEKGKRLKEMSVIVGIKYQVGRTEGRTKVCRVIFNEF